MSHTPLGTPFSSDDVVVIADDETFSRFMVAEMLERLGVPRTKVARDGNETIALLNGDLAPAIRLILLDFNMPGRNGLELLRDIRRGALRVSPAVPVMMVTGVEVFGLVAAAIALDVDAFLTKPMTLDDLRANLDAVATAERDIASPADYAAVDLSGLEGRHVPPPARDGEPVPVTGLAEGMVVAQDLIDPNGNLLLAQGTVVTARVARLFRGLAAAGLPLDGLRVIKSD